MREDITDLVNIDLTIRNLSSVHMTKKKERKRSYVDGARVRIPLVYQWVKMAVSSFGWFVG